MLMMMDLEERSRRRREAIESLLAIKNAIDHPRHQEDARVLRAVLERRARLDDD